MKKTLFLCCLAVFFLCFEHSVYAIGSNLDESSSKISLEITDGGGTDGGGTDGGGTDGGGINLPQAGEHRQVWATFIGIILILSWGVLLPQKNEVSDRRSEI